MAGYSENYSSLDANRESVANFWRVVLASTVCFFIYNQNANTVNPAVIYTEQIIFGLCSVGIYPAGVLHIGPMAENVLGR